MTAEEKLAKVAEFVKTLEASGEFFSNPDTEWMAGCVYASKGAARDLRAILDA